MESIRNRAWDLIHKEMHNDFQCMWIDSDDKELLPSGIIYSSEISKHDFSVWPPEHDKERRFVIMNWIHAVDGMNMPIYEYDLLKVIEPGVGEWVGIVVWGKKGCAICCDISKIENGTLKKNIFFDKEGVTFSIVGNIYENREMVEHLYEAGWIKDPE